jgi:hypothetical protein
MKFYQHQITAEHPNIAMYEHVLRNIQNCYNAVRLNQRKDELEATTEMFTDNIEPTNQPNEEPTYDIDMGLVDEADDQDEGSGLFHEIEGCHFSIGLDVLRADGKNKCGFEYLSIPIPTNRPLDLTNNTHRHSNTNENSNSNPVHHTQERITRARLIELTFRTDTSRRRRPQSTTPEEVDMIDPNGTKESIISWGQFYGLDDNQQGAFEVAASNFVMTYHLETDHYNHDFTEQQQETMHHISRIDLESLGAKQQLIMFMTGAGGAGKSNVITALIEYCKEFCANLGVLFDNQTIVITALTGVAATSIMGQTTSTGLGMTRTVTDNKFIKSFKDTRMILIDEVSFCKAFELGQIDRSMRIVKQEPDLTYGGVHVIFSGDFHQLPPIGKGAIPIWHNSLILWHGVLNSFVELKGKWRFAEDPEWGELLERLRVNASTQADIAILQSRVISTK